MMEACNYFYVNEFDESTESKRGKNIFARQSKYTILDSLILLLVQGNQ